MHDPSHDHEPATCCGRRNEPVHAGAFEWLRPLRRGVVKMLGASLLFLPQVAAAAVKVLERCGPTPKPPKPAQASSAEGLPPLPLPVVPQRRTEKKNPPRPPVIVSKIKYGDISDWGTDYNDINNLLIWMKSKIGVNFTYEEKPLDQVPLESGQVPVLYRTGHNAFEFTAAQRTRLREYLLRGGMMIFDACCGRPAFADAARVEIAAILPDHPLKPIPLDHPLLHCYYENAGVVRFTGASLSNRPGLRSPGPSQIEGVEIACRMAVVFSPHDLSCGWDMHTHSLSDTSYIESEDALKIGANLMAYATATRDLAVGPAHAKQYVDADLNRADKFRVGQLVHEGDWNPDAVGLSNLLDTVAATTSLRISFETEPLQISDQQLGLFPFIYMTGHDEFRWDEQQAATIRRYLANGGFIFADACCGRQKFDVAFRREMRRVLSPLNTRLEPLAINHPLYAIHHSVSQVKYTEAARFRFGQQLTDRPRLEAAGMDGRVAVVYSPVGLNVGWRLKPVAYAVNYEPKSALQLGVNVVIYAMSQ